MVAHATPKICRWKEAVDELKMRRSSPVPVIKEEVKKTKGTLGTFQAVTALAL
jgi:hypothetical protein